MKRWLWGLMVLPLIALAQSPFSPDGSVITPAQGTNANLINTDGTWNFQTAAMDGTAPILLNGQSAANAKGMALEVYGGGRLYAFNIYPSNPPRWYLWDNTTNPKSWKSLGIVTVPTTVKVSWTAPTQNIDGSNITVPLTYNVYQDEGPSAPISSLKRIQSGITGLTYTVSAGLPVATQQCFAVTAVGNGVESPYSATVCAWILPPIPTASPPPVVPQTPTAITVVPGGTLSSSLSKKGPAPPGH